MEMSMNDMYARSYQQQQFYFLAYGGVDASVGDQYIIDMRKKFITDNYTRINEIFTKCIRPGGYSEKNHLSSAKTARLVVENALVDKFYSLLSNGVDDAIRLMTIRDVRHFMCNHFEEIEAAYYSAMKDNAHGLSEAEIIRNVVTEANKKEKNPIISAVLTPGVTAADIEAIKKPAPHERKVDIQKNNNENIKKTEETPDFRG